MKIKRSQDFNFGILILAVTIFYFFLTIRIETKEGLITSRTIPLILSSSMSILGVLQIFKGMKNKEINKVIKSDVDITTVIKTCLAIIIYICLFNPVGFLVTTTIFLFYMFYVLSPEYRKPNIKMYIFISATMSIGIYILFKYGLDIMLPQGIIGGI